MMWSSAYYFEATALQNINSYARLKIFVNISFPANSYSLHPIDLKLHIEIDHAVEQRILYRGFSPPNIYRVTPL